MKQLLFAIVALCLLGLMNGVSFAQDAIFNFYESPFVSEDMYARYTPRTMTPLIARLPEYALLGPGYICDKRQPPPVYRFPLQYNRHIGYREADWTRNAMVDQHMFPLNFGGYTF